MPAHERREQLLDVTKALVGEQGFHDVSIEAIARRAGVTRPVVYGHFKDLEELLEAMLEREGARALGQLAAILPVGIGEGADARAALLAALRGYLETIQADPVTWRLVLIPPEGAPEAHREQVTRGREAVIAALAEVVQPGLSPDRPSPDPALTARLLSALSDEAARLMLTDPDQYPIERLVAQADWLLRQLISS
jgi:AcrR family transcriptional regulator